MAFPAGANELLPPEQEKLTALGKTLAERPGLRLDITGAADSNVDGRALAEAKLLTQLKQAKFVQQSPSGDQASVSMELLELTNEEEAQYLMQLYVKKIGAFAISKEEGTPKAQEAGSESISPQAPTVAEMKAKILEDIFLEEGQLRVLAQQRAQRIRDYLIQEGKVQGNQVFLVEVSMNPVAEEGMVQSPLALTAN